MNFLSAIRNGRVLGWRRQARFRHEARSAKQTAPQEHFELPIRPEDWGFPATQIFLGPQFDGIKAFWFVADNAVDCFGMDEFYVDEPPPSRVPEPAGLALLGLGIAGLLMPRRRK